jgi:hypothetical protein
LVELEAKNRRCQDHRIDKMPKISRLKIAPNGLYKNILDIRDVIGIKLTFNEDDGSEQAKIALYRADCLNKLNDAFISEIANIINKIETNWKTKDRLNISKD